MITEEGEIYSQRLIGNQKVKRWRKLKPKNPGANNPSKYLSVIAVNEDGLRTFQIHRLVALYFVDGYFDGAVVNHKDGNNRNNHYSNLEWVTQKENIHKSYESSGIDQTRNYFWWEFYSPDNVLLGVFKGMAQLADYIKEQDIPVSTSMLTKWKHNKGYYIIKKDKTTY